jgi:hypothetical protein
VLRFHNPPSIKRVFPFDSGAFRRERLPSYIAAFRLDGYEIAGDPQNIGRVISFFFGTPERYFRRRALSDDDLKEQHHLDMRHQEILALGRLYRDGSTAQCDDRAAAIEVQIEEDVVLARENLLGVVLPEEFKRVPGLLDALHNLTPRVEFYIHIPVNSAMHHGFIYERVEWIYRQAGVRL